MNGIINRRCSRYIYLYSINIYGKIYSSHKFVYFSDACKIGNPIFICPIYKSKKKSLSYFLTLSYLVISYRKIIKENGRELIKKKR